MKEYGKTISTKMPIELDTEFRQVLGLNGHTISKIIEVAICEYISMYSDNKDMVDYAQRFQLAVSSKDRK